GRPSRAAAHGADRARHRHRPALSGADPPAARLAASRPRARRLSRRGGGGGRGAELADLSAHERGRRPSRLRRHRGLRVSRAAFAGRIVVVTGGAGFIGSHGTLRVLMAARRHGVRRAVYVSSSEVYGSGVRVPMAEDHPLEPTTIYGATKLAGELYTQAATRSFGLETIVVRPFNTYGP